MKALYGMVSMRNVQCRDLIFGQGLPKICVPLVGKSIEELKKEYQYLRSLPADLVEWRADCFEGEIEEAFSVLSACREQFPLLVTLRTVNEGGSWQGTEDEYEKILSQWIDLDFCDLIDIEFSLEEKRIKRLLDKAHKKNIVTILSKHDFVKTPPENEISDAFRAMKELGADLPKYAVMPHQAEDVIKMLSASTKMQGEVGPLVAICMGQYGKISRVSGEFFGSAITFATGLDASAPGQLSCQNANTILQLLKME
ncbi:type I 3-dehydroquinate dehydratase [Scatolibacter rhodanostii]|uniref:type I 3-dehydroquinate dehydratase n=1 Tax=Scatolibacter rhodanostii TaxID=2014781 RepID=UPI000C07B76D|nr:type I 3-dehydroquinate dehydratase [Scatolibacter rhodanostii]